MTNATMQARDNNSAQWGSRLGWLLFIWSASVLALSVGAYAFRLVMKWSGLTG